MQFADRNHGQWKDKTSGEPKESTEWHRIVLFRRHAEIANEFLKKGSAVFIEGRLRTRKWHDRDGQDRYTTEVEATEMQMLGSRASHLSQEMAEKERPTTPVSRSPDVIDFGDVPF